MRAGGGGAGGAGANGGGGVGIKSSITGVEVGYAGGGGPGGGDGTAYASATDGGGRGSFNQFNSGNNATANTGGGGGGAGFTNNLGGAGGSGVVIIAFPSNLGTLTVPGSLTYTLGSKTVEGVTSHVYTFTEGTGNVTLNKNIPNAPTIGSVTPGNAQVTVAFTPNTDTTGLDITGYSATCTDGTTPVTIQGTASPITVTGLTNNTSYTCTVTAINAAGESAKSAASSSVTPMATLRLEDLTFKNMQITPNPFNNNLSITIPNTAGNFSIKLYDINGRLVYAKTYTTTNGTMRLDALSSLQSGPYFLNITSEKTGASTVKAVIKN